MLSWEVLYRVLSLLSGFGVMAGIWKLVGWAIRLEPRLKAIEKQSDAYGQMLQQMESTVSRIEGWLEGQTQWDGKTERRRNPFPRRTP
jgi:hypothetical protein